MAAADRIEKAIVNNNENENDNDTSGREGGLIVAYSELALGMRAASLETMSVPAPGQPASLLWCAKEGFGGRFGYVAGVGGRVQPGDHTSAKKARKGEKEGVSIISQSHRHAEDQNEVRDNVNLRWTVSADIEDDDDACVWLYGWQRRSEQTGASPPVGLNANGANFR